MYSTVWKQIWDSTNSRLVHNTALIKCPVCPGRYRDERDGEVNVQSNTTIGLISKFNRFGPFLLI